MSFRSSISLRARLAGHKNSYVATFEVDCQWSEVVGDTLSNDGGSLVVEDNVWSPDVIRRHVETLDPAILLRLPGQLVVAPVLLHPQVGRHDLVLQILKSVLKHFTRINISNEIACQSQNMDSDIRKKLHLSRQLGTLTG